MPTLYFLDGLGSNRHYVAPLQKALASKGIDLHYLALPGHPENLTCTIHHMDDLVNWFEAQVPDTGATVMGFSLGADLAAALAMNSQRIERLILLDGAIQDWANYPIDKELHAAKEHLANTTISDFDQYLLDKAKQTPYWSEDLAMAEQLAFIKGKDHLYHLNLVPETILALLRIRHHNGLILANKNYQTPTLLILAEKPEGLLATKQQLLTQLSNHYVSHLILKGTTHDLYLEAPDKIALATAFFLDTV